jgi:hypothetical protein
MTEKDKTLLAALARAVVAAEAADEERAKGGADFKPWIPRVAGTLRLCLSHALHGAADDMGAAALEVAAAEAGITLRRTAE